MDNQFEATGNMNDWPPNVHGKRTRAAVFGVFHPKKGKRLEILWTGDFPDLQPAMYWAAKKEMEACRKGKWMMASRLLWQHDLTPEQALEVMKQEMGPQVDRALRSMGSAHSADEIDIGSGPMRMIRPGEAERYVEVVSTDTGETLGSFIVPPDPPEEPGPEPHRN